MLLSYIPGQITLSAAENVPFIINTFYQSNEQ